MKDTQKAGRRSLKTNFLNFFRRFFIISHLDSLLRRWTCGRPTSHLLSKLVPNHYQYRRPTERKLVKDGLTVELDISDYLGHYCYFGFLDGSLTKLLSLVAAGDNVIDVGANVGVTALHLAAKASPGHVLSLEPDQLNFERARRNFQLNQSKNITLLKTAAGSDDLVATMEVRTADNRGGNRISPHTERRDNVVQVSPLDKLLKTVPLGRIGLIKIDVEGYELHVLTGARQTILTDHPLLFIEINDNNLRDQGSSAKSVIFFLNESGYFDLTRADNSEPVTLHDDFTGCHFDLVARTKN